MDNKKIIQEIPNIDPKEVKSGKWEIGDISYDQDGDTKFTVTSINKETGAVKWEVKKLPAFDKLFDDSTELVDTAKGVYQKAKDDNVIKQIYSLSKDIRNKIRTHLRNDYPDEYKRIVMKMTENEVEENTTTGGGSAGFTPGTGMTYATPYAFRRPKKKQKAIPENLDKIAGGIPYRYENGLAIITEPLDDDTKERIIKRAKEKGYYAAPNMAGGVTIHDKNKLKENLNLSSYGYKLVPKNKAGNYVQKGSKLDVKQLFEDQKEFQSKRISAFDAIEQEMNDIYKMLSNAKNETSEYYNDNPSSYTVIKPTDLVLDYIKDIKNLLKGE